MDINVQNFEQIVLFIGSYNYSYFEKRGNFLKVQWIQTQEKAFYAIQIKESL